MDDDLPDEETRAPRGHAPKQVGNSFTQTTPSASRLVGIRHHPAVWVVPAGLLVVAILPLPYGFYIFLRLGICAISVWLAFEQWRHDDAVSGWVVMLGAITLAYNPFVIVHISREIWTILNIVTALIFIGHFWFLRRLVAEDALSIYHRESKMTVSSICHPNTKISNSQKSDREVGKSG